MIRHIVFYRLQESCNHNEAISEIKAALEPLSEVIPGLSVMQIRPVLSGEYDDMLYSEFLCEEALAAYKTHPAHLAVKPLVHRFICERTAADSRI